ncbi:peptidoglycan DD-metalloendopeptidase family protein [Hyunsoonleella rubra]|uniref:Peptidoglycan DD-metalloendopeptidase family protein n=1 Tax=Hyunsoonleella rubra TaxID=1737062 RepID=A0ABW5TBY6_9FLAO
MTPNEFQTFLKSICPKPLHVLDVSIPKSKYVHLDLSESNLELQNVNTASSADFSKYIDSCLKRHNALVAYGGYNEVRTIYNRSHHFNTGESERRSIHLGLDLWCDAGTSIYAPLDGEVHSFKNNDNFGDYGPTIILEHSIFGTRFYTLYGHLSLESIADLSAGQVLKKGEVFASLGDVSINGDYPPHLHFQIIRDLQGYFGDYPGVCCKADLAFYLGNCPDPGLVLGF